MNFCLLCRHLFQCLCFDRFQFLIYGCLQLRRFSGWPKVSFHHSWGLAFLAEFWGSFRLSSFFPSINLAWIKINSKAPFVDEVFFFASELHMSRTNSSFFWESVVLFCKLQSRTGGKLVKKFSVNKSWSHSGWNLNKWTWINHFSMKNVLKYPSLCVKILGWTVAGNPPSSRSHDATYSYVRGI